MKTDDEILWIKKMKMTFEEYSCLIIKRPLKSNNIRRRKNPIIDFKHPDILINCYRSYF